jgi:predicted DNA-binding transcriptional regulator AlpA
MTKEALYGEEDRLLKTSDVAKMVGLTRVTIANMVDTKQFPEPDWVSESGYKHWWKSTIYFHFNKKQALAS